MGDGRGFHTWRFEGEVNLESMVEPNKVRQSHRYKVDVRLPDGEWAESFVHEAIPRNGRGRIYSPWDHPRSNTLDPFTLGPFKMGPSVDDGITTGVEVESSGKALVTMAWTQFEYQRDVEVKISRGTWTRGTWTIDRATPDLAANVVIRPTTQPYEIKDAEDGGIIVLVPRDDHGRRFSVEFHDDSLEYRTNLYFPPGVFWIEQAASGSEPKYGENHLRLHENTRWVHLDAGAYVKGAIEYSYTGGAFFATGHGVLSGEHYVYQANPETFYQAVKCDGNSLRMWSHKGIRKGQSWHCVGPTIASPPFNTMDFHGSDEIASTISDYKQVGAYFFQTDGPQMYSNSIIQDVFLHVNDDAIKVYHSGVTLSRATIWKCHNDPVIQIGWDARDVSGVFIDSLNVIHSRYRRSEVYVPSAIIGGSPFYCGGKAVDPTKTFEMTVSNLSVEGPCGGAPALIRIIPLVNYDIKLRGVIFHNGLLDGQLGESIVPEVKDGDGRRLEMKLSISDWFVDGKLVTMENFHHDRLGRLNIHESYWNHWKIHSSAGETEST